MLDLSETKVRNDAPEWLPFAVTIALAGLVVAAVLSTTFLVSVLKAALTVIVVYLAVCFACHAVATICNVTAGLNTLFQSWRG